MSNVWAVTPTREPRNQMGRPASYDLNKSHIGKTPLLIHS